VSRNLNSLESNLQDFYYIGIYYCNFIPIVWYNEMLHKVLTFCLEKCFSLVMYWKM